MERGLRDVKAGTGLLWPDAILDNRLTPLVRNDTPPLARMARRALMAGIPEIVERAVNAVRSVSLWRAVGIDREAALKKERCRVGCVLELPDVGPSDRGEMRE